MFEVVASLRLREVRLLVATANESTCQLGCQHQLVALTPAALHNSLLQLLCSFEGQRCHALDLVFEDFGLARQYFSRGPSAPAVLAMKARNDSISASNTSAMLVGIYLKL